MMEEYLRKQKEAQQKGKAAVSRDPSESSDRYDEDFESMSRSQTGLGGSMLPSPHGQNQQKQPQTKAPFDYKKPVEEYKNSIIQKYVKKENKAA